MVFYRKYRPQTINELDSAAVREQLFSVLSLPEPPHAFLFTGPKGLGKTSTARIVAKVVNCEKRSSVFSRQSTAKKDRQAKDQRPATNDQLEPCNECEQCLSITNGTNLDILEIDAASNRGIDEIRDLRDKIKLAPLSAKKKVYIIDEVHMLTTEAFNALLKTLEEPPSHAMFILCTTELQKVPATILSRCFHVQFFPATKDEIARSFKRIAEGEGLVIEEAAIAEIVQLADGGFRDGHKILEELVSMGDLPAGRQGKTITLELVEKRYKVSSIKYHVSSMIGHLEKKDTKAMLELIENVVKQGEDVKLFMQQLVDLLHSFLLQKAGVQKIQDLRFKIYEFDMGELKELLELLARANQEMKYAIIPQLPLELAVIEWGGSQINADQNADEHREKDQPVSAYQSASISGPTVASMRKQVGNLARVKALYGEDKSQIKDTEKPQPVVSAVNLLQISNTEITPEWLNAFWNTLISETKQHNHTIAGVLRGCMIKQFDKKTLVIETAYTFHKERLDDSKTRMMLEDVCKILTGNPIRVEVVLKA